MDGFTPGPWEVGQHPAMSRGWIVRPVLFGSRVVALPEWDGGHVVLKSEADAHLIAAAPELLEMAKLALRMDDEWKAFSLDERTRLEAAISKAEGSALSLADGSMGEEK